MFIHPAIIAAGGESLPTGALGVWYGNQYQSSPRPYIPNAAQPAAPAPKNLLAWPRRQFLAGFGYATTGSVTVTDRNAVGPDGLTEASTLVMGSNATFSATTAVSLPAGTYTFALYGKSADASTYNIRYGSSLSNFSTNSFGAAWTRFTHTFTLGSTTSINALIAWAQAGAANILVCDVGLFVGASDPGADPICGHILLGKSATANIGSYSGGVVDLSTPGIGHIQFSGDQTSTNFTGCAVLKKVATGSTIQAIYSLPRSATSFNAEMENTNSSAVGLGLRWTNVVNSLLYYNGDATKLFGSFRLISWRYDGTYFSVFIDDVLAIKESHSGLTAKQFQDISLGCVLQNTVFSSGYSFAGGAMWLRDLTDTEIRQAFYHFTAKIADSVTLSKSLIIYAPEGDSISALSNSWCYQYLPNANPSTLMVMKAVAGSAFATLNSRASVTTDPTIWPAATAAGRKFIMSLLTGANDLKSIGSSSYLSSLATYCDARRAAGWKLALCTITPQTDATFNTNRATANTTIRTWAGVHADAIIDFAGDPTMGPDAAASDLSLYRDGVHPTDAGFTILEGIARPVLNAL